MNKPHPTGFTLIELLVVSVILSVLAAGALVSYASTTSKSRDSKRLGDIEQVRSALEMSRADNGSYITATGTVCGQLGALATANYIAKLPFDPKLSTCGAAGWTDFRYVSPAGATYSICASLEHPPAAVSQSCVAATVCGASYNYCTKNP